MANENLDQIDLFIDDDKKSATEEIKIEKSDDKTDRKIITPDEGIAEVKLQLEEERRARSEAERRMHEANANVQRAKTEVEDTNLQLVSSAIETIKRENQIAKASYVEAAASGDFSRMADFQEAMAMNSARLLQLENGKSALEQRPKIVQQQNQPQSDPVEALASQLSPRSADWVRRHPEYARDTRLFNRMRAAHELAVSDDYAPDTDSYFRHIESTLRISKQEAVEAESPFSDASNSNQRRSPPAAAPVSRSSGGAGSKPNVVRLSSEEREMAKMMGQTDQEYAKNKLALIKEGKLSH